MSSTNTKRIVRNTILLYVRMLLIMGVTLYTSRIVLNVLGVEDFGIYNVVAGIVIMFSFLNGAMSQSTQRFLSFEMGQAKFCRLQKIFSLSLTVHLGIACLILLLAETAGLWFFQTQMNIPAERETAACWIYQFSIFSFMVSVMQVPYHAAIIAHERMQVYAYISIAEVVLKLLVVYMLAVMPGDKLKVYGVLMFGTTVFIAFLYRGYCTRVFPECRYQFVWEWALYKKLTSFAGWSMFGNLAWLVKSQGLNLTLNLFFGPLLNASYGIANQVNTAINSFVLNFTTALNPQIIKSYAAADRSYMLHLLFRGARFSYYLLLLLTLPLLIETKEILRLWLKVVPDYTVIFTRLVLVNSLLESFAYPMGSCILATGKIKGYQLLVGGTIMLNLPVAWVLLKWHFAPQVVFVVSVVISCITLAERLFILHYLIKLNIKQFLMDVFGKSIGVTCLAYCLLWLLCLLWPTCKGEGILMMASCFISTLLAVFFVGLSARERNYFLQKVKHYIK